MVHRFTFVNMSVLTVNTFEGFPESYCAGSMLADFAGAAGEGVVGSTSNNCG